MHSAHFNDFAAHANALENGQPQLHELISQAQTLGLDCFTDTYGNVFLTPAHLANAPLYLGFGAEHIQTAHTLLAKIKGHAISLCYVGTTTDLDLPVKAAPRGRGFLLLSAVPPVEQHLKSRWYQIECAVDDAGKAPAMALSHKALVHAFHAVNRIQQLAETLAGPGALTLSFSQLHPLLAQHKVHVNFVARHQEPLLLETFNEQLSQHLKAIGSITPLLQNLEHHQGFSHLVNKLCQQLATRAYPVTASALNDAMYLAQGPSALVTMAPQASTDPLATLLQTFTD